MSSEGSTKDSTAKLGYLGQTSWGQSMAIFSFLNFLLMLSIWNPFLNLGYDFVDVLLNLLRQHVLDSSAPNVDEQRSSVLEVLQKIGVSEEKIQNMIEVWNKIDLLNKHDETMFEGEEERDGRGTEVVVEEHELKEAGEDDGVSSKIQNGKQISSFTEAASRVETSAITGTGLKDLLSLVSEKLAAQKLVEKTKVDEPFDRKWRPSHETEISEIAAEQ